jgi:hypothetical protein
MIHHHSRIHTNMAVMQVLVLTSKVCMLMQQQVVVQGAMHSPHLALLVARAPIVVIWTGGVPKLGQGVMPGVLIPVYLPPRQ